MTSQQAQREGWIEEQVALGYGGVRGRTTYQVSETKGPP